MLVPIVAHRCEFQKEPFALPGASDGRFAVGGSAASGDATGGLEGEAGAAGLSDHSEIGHYFKIDRSHFGTGFFRETCRPLS